jgi:hypothetical protein
MRKDKLPYSAWFGEQSYHALGNNKFSFLAREEEVIELSPAFKGFRGWLEEIRSCFVDGIKARPTEKPTQWKIKRARGPSRFGSTPVPYDDETLGGYVDYSTIIEPVRDLKGDLEGLVIRYDP